MQFKVLVVDDEPGWQVILTEYLHQYGYETVIAQEYETAVRVLQTEICHVAIIDLKLKTQIDVDFTGIDLVQHIAEMGDGPVCSIALTGYPITERVRKNLQNYGVHQYISKIDFEPSAFLQTVDKALTQNKVRLESELNNKWQNFINAQKLLQFVTASKAINELLSYFLQALQLSNPKPITTEHPHLLALQVDASALFSDIQIAQPISIFALGESIIQEQLLGKLDQLLVNSLPQPNCVGLFVIANLDQYDLIMPVLERIRQVFSCDVIPLTYRQCSKIFTATDPRGYFKNEILSKINLKAISPFVISGPAYDSIFFGRDHELREITQQIHLSNFAIIGGRLIGKTSILKQLERVRLPSLGFYTLYCDCSPCNTEAELVQLLIDGMAEFHPKAMDIVSFSQFMRLLPSDKSSVILFDEADKLIKFDSQLSYSLLSLLRASANRGQCRFVFAGEKILRSELVNPDSPLYNFANQMVVGRLDSHAVAELVIQPLKQLSIEFEAELEIVRRIWNFTSGHPNIVQRLCQHLVIRLNERGDRQLTVEDVEAIVGDPGFLRRDFLSVYWERSTSLERLCSLIMAKDDSIRTLMTVHEKLDSHNVHATFNEVDEALERLVDLRNILHRTSEGYKFAVTAFPEVLAKTHRLEDLIALNRETYQHYGDVEPRSKRGYQ